VDASSLRKCVRCGELKPATPKHFHKSKLGRDGLHTHCKPCDVARHREWRARNATYDRDHMRATSRGEKQPRRPSRPKHGRNKENARAYDLRNRDLRNAQHNAWRKLHPEKNRAWVACYRARMAKAPGSHTSQDLLDLYEEQDGRCSYCGMPLRGEYEVEHMTPISRGGSNDRDNLCLSCESCNASKQNRTADEFYRNVGVGG
jgi:hypothetical protein